VSNWVPFAHVFSGLDFPQHKLTYICHCTMEGPLTKTLTSRIAKTRRQGGREREEREREERQGSVCEREKKREREWTMTEYKTI
jgi:hypothetical protein